MPHKTEKEDHPYRHRKFKATPGPPCVDLMKDGKLLVPTMPKLAPPPQEMTREQRRVERSLNPLNGFRE
ncbi:MAG TPA: hypothetical protein VEU11_09240 [Terriglobales bacterium]|nr:hypothetical protein [Terriglobales bacterium]